MSTGDFGDHRPDLVELDIAAYEKWLHRLAYDLLPRPRWGEHEDLVNEGRLAMWRAMAAYDPSKGALPTWVTTAARMRMRNLLGKGRWTGHEPMRGVVPAPHPPASLDVLIEEDEDFFGKVLAAADLVERVELAYHHGEILAALADLTEPQRRYVVLRFWGGLSDVEMVREGHFAANPGWLWRDHSRGARTVLRQRLAHLAGAA